VEQALGEAIPEALGFIEGSVTRMDHIIAALLRLSRLGYWRLQMEELDTGAVLHDALRDKRRRDIGRPCRWLVCVLKTRALSIYTRN
jgi:signal transduction histidine kinase